MDAFFALRGSGRPAVVREHLARPSAPRALDQRTLLRLLRTAARDATIRDRAICHLAYYAGLRIAEIVALDVADLRLSARKGSVRVRGKGRSGGKDRTVPLHAQARATLAELLDELGRPAAGPLIRNRDGRALSTRAANTVVTALLRFGNGGVLADNDPVEQEKLIKLNTLLANLVIFHNALDIADIVRALVAEGWTITAEDLAD